MEETHIDYLAGGYSCHVAPYQPSGEAAGTRLCARHGQGQLLSTPGYDDFPPAVHKFGANGNSTADIQACSVDGCSYAADLDPDTELLPDADQAFGGHFGRHSYDIAGTTALSFNADGSDPNRDESLPAVHQALGGIAGITLSVSGDGGFGPNGGPLSAGHQALGGHPRGCSYLSTANHVQGIDGHPSVFSYLSTADHAQALGGHPRGCSYLSTADELDGHLRRCSYLSTADHVQALGGHFRWYVAGYTNNVHGIGFGPNGDPLAAYDKLQLLRGHPSVFSYLSTADHVQALGGHFRRYAPGYSNNVHGIGFGPNGEPLAARDKAQAQLLRGKFRGCFYAPGVESSGSADLFGRMRISEATTVQSVWRDNCAEVFARVVDKLRRPRRHLYIALDLEFVADASTDVRYRPISWIDWYEQLRTFINGGDVLQVGLALAFGLEPHHGYYGGVQALSPVVALEINLEFDKDARQYNGASISFLSDQGHCLAEHRDRGVTAEQFLDGLLRHLPFGDGFVTWVTYHGDRDFGFLLRLLQSGGRGALPLERAAFMRQVRRAFPIFYDVRVLGQLVKEGFSGKLTALAEHLGVQRIGGEHHAGSDALLTLSCFLVILRFSERQLHRLDSRQCLLSGMEEYDMAIKCAWHINNTSVTTVKVLGRDFHEEAQRIHELVTSNFKIVGVHVVLPLLGWGSPLNAAAAEQQDYGLMKSSLEGITEFQVVIGFMNAEGMLAYGRLWKFYLRCSNVGTNLAKDTVCVHPRRLAWLLASCGATHNPNVVWATHQGSQGIACLTKSFLAADDLPADWCSYIKRLRGHFPRMYDVRLIAQRWPDIGVLSAGCIGDLCDIAQNLNVIKDDDKQPIEKALLVLRCYYKRLVVERQAACGKSELSLLI